VLPKVLLFLSVSFLCYPACRGLVFVSFLFEFVCFEK
jgi:hypothetical protein